MTHTATSPTQCDESGEEGSVVLFLIVVVLALFAVFGLVVDGGARIDAGRQAGDQAEQAARAAAQTIDPTSLRDGDTIRLAPAAARQAAANYLAVAGRMTLTGIQITGDTVTITVTTSVQPAVLSLIGLHSLTVTATGHAQLLRGPAAGAGAP